MRIEDKVFNGSSVNLDGVTFVRCTFDGGCLLVFGGRAGFFFDTCKFPDARGHLAHDALTALDGAVALNSLGLWDMAAYVAAHPTVAATRTNRPQPV